MIDGRVLKPQVCGTTFLWRLGVRRFDRITIESGKCSGEPCVRGLRIPVHLILSLLASGETPEAVLENYPELEMEDIRQTLAYAAEHVRENVVLIPA